MAKSTRPTPTAGPTPNATPKPIEKEDPRTVNDEVHELLEATETAILDLLASSRMSLKRAIVSATFKRLKYHFRTGYTNPLNNERKKFEPITPAPLEEKDQKGVKTIQSEELQREVVAIYDSFLDRETDELLSSLDEIQIRAVAIRAHMSHVTERNPERITPAFIEEIKAAIRTVSANKAITTDPAKVTRDEYARIDAALKGITDRKEGIEKALEDKTLTVEKKKALSAELVQLTVEEGTLYETLDKLSEAIGDGGNQD